jgi:LAO/AO transport system kinase
MRRALPDIETLVEGIRASDRVLLGQAITLVESARPEHMAQAQAVIDRLLAAQSTPPDTLRVGITGAPGSGKSTLIEALGCHCTARGHRVAVLAVDPSSALSKGSILGDKTRMERLSTDPNAFVRPSPAGDALGGVARKTREAILLVEAAGFDTVLVETVGVGQSEMAVHRMTDIFVLLLLPGAGDELQGIKRGIVEMADLLVVNKSDGERVALANQARAHYLNATHLLPPKPSGWAPQVLASSALEGKGVTELWAALESYRTHAQANGFFAENRREQGHFWFSEALDQGLKALFHHHGAVRAQLAALDAAVRAGKRSPFAAAAEVLAFFEKKLSG